MTPKVPTPRTDAVESDSEARELCAKLETELAQARGLLERLYGHWTDQGFTDDVIGEEIQQFLSREGK